MQFYVNIDIQEENNNKYDRAICKNTIELQRNWCEIFKFKLYRIVFLSKKKIIHEKIFESQI